jgi:hypothetical protein
MTTAPHHPIGIIGGGLRDLILAPVLHVNGVDAAAVERDPSSEVRTQGSILDIHDDGTGGRPVLDRFVSRSAR